MKKTRVQELAEFLGWDRRKAHIVKQGPTEIAPNGTRRERRINNDYMPTDEELDNQSIIEINRFLL